VLAFVILILTMFYMLSNSKKIQILFVVEYMHQ
jgi:hypothetical protein